MIVYDNLDKMEEIYEIRYKCCYSHDKIVSPFIIITVICSYVIGSMYLTSKFWKKRDLFPLKARAPQQTVLQFYSFASTLLIPFGVEVLLRLEILNWEDTNSIPHTRYLLKSAYFTARLLSPFIFTIRVVYILTVWKLKVKKNTMNAQISRSVSYEFCCKPPGKIKRNMFWWVYEIFSDEKLVAIVTLMICVIMFVFYYAIADYYFTATPFFDYFHNVIPNPYVFWQAKVFNFTWIHIVELLILFVSIFCVFKFPKEFKIADEFIIYLTQDFIIGCIFEFVRCYSTGHACFFLITLDAWMNIFRLLTFQISSIIFPMNRSSSLFPFPFSNVFLDFSRFITEDICLEYFAKYINNKDRLNIETLESVLDVYKRAMENNIPSATLHNHSTGNFNVLSNYNDETTKKNVIQSNLSSSVICDEETKVKECYEKNMKKLHKSYLNFTKTVAFNELKVKIYNFEKITNKLFLEIKVKKQLRILAKNSTFFSVFYIFFLS